MAKGPQRQYTYGMICSYGETSTGIEKLIKCESNCAIRVTGASDAVSILAFQVLHPLRLIELMTAVFLAPAIKTLQRYARIPAGHRRRFALCHLHFTLTQQRYDMLRDKTC